MPSSWTSGGFRRTRFCVVVAALLLADVGAAEVELSTSVNRVVRLATEDGGMEALLFDAWNVQSGQELRYTIEFNNASSEFIDPGVIVITNPIPETAEYLDGTATGADTQIEFSVDGGTSFASPESLTVVENGVQVPATAPHYTTIRFTFNGILGPGEGSAVSFDVRLLEESPPASAQGGIL